MNLTVTAYNGSNYKPVFKNQALKNATLTSGKEIYNRIAGKTILNITPDDIARVKIKALSCYIPELFFANKSAKESAKVFEKEQEMVDIFAEGSKEDILKLIDEKGADYITKIKKDEDGIFHSFAHTAFANKSADVLDGIIDKIGLDALLEREDGFYNPIEMGCKYNKNPEAVIKIYDRVIAEKGTDYITEQNKASGGWSLANITFCYNSAEVLGGLIDKFGPELFLNKNKEFYNPVDIACIDNKSPEAVGTILDKIIDTEAYEKAYIAPEEEIYYDTEEDCDGNIIKIKRRRYISRWIKDQPAMLTLRYSKNPDVIEHVYNKIKTDKRFRDVMYDDLEWYEEHIFEDNKNPEVVERFIDILGKDNVMKIRTYEDGSFNPSYLDYTFDKNTSPEVIGMLIDKFGIEPLMVKNRTNYSNYKRSILDKYFSSVFIDRDDTVTKTILEKIGPVSIINGNVYLLNQCKHQWFYKLFGDVYTKEDFENENEDKIE